MLPNPVPDLFNDTAWRAATELSDYETRPYTIVENCLTDEAIDHFSAQPPLEEIPIDPPPYDEVLVELSCALDALTEHLLGTHDVEDNLDYDFRVKPPTEIDAEEVHMDMDGTFLLMTLFQESGADGTPWRLRMWPDWEWAPDEPDYAPMVDVKTLAAHNGQPVDLDSTAGRLIILGGKAVQSASGNYSVAHQVIRPDYADEPPVDRIVRVRIKHFALP